MGIRGLLYLLVIIPAVGALAEQKLVCVTEKGESSRSDLQLTVSVATYTRRM
jgi:hypothetical protein